MEEKNSSSGGSRQLEYFLWKLRHFFSRKETKQLVVLAIVLLALPVGVFLVNNYVRYRSRAEGEDVNLYLVPSEQSLPSDATFQVMLDALTNRIGFVRVEFTFDNAKVNLASEIQTTSSLSTVVEKTTRADANGNGRATIVLGLAPADQANSPTGIFEIANFSLTSISETSNDGTTISFDDAKVQIVDMDLKALTFSSAGSNLTLNSLSAAPSARLYFSDPRPANPQQLNSSFDVDILLDTGGQDVYGVDARITFDKSFLRVSSLVNNSSSVFSSYPASEYDNDLGTVVVSANVGSEQSTTPINESGINVATITFDPILITTSTQIVYDFTAGERNDSNVVLAGRLESEESVDILESVTNSTIVIETITPTPTETIVPVPTETPMPTPTSTTAPPVSEVTDTPIPTQMSPAATATPTATSTPTIAPSPTVAASPTQVPQLSLIVRLLFQGRTRVGVNKVRPVVVRYRNTSGGGLSNALNMYTNTSGEIQLAITPGNYLVLVKSPGYLARKFGDFISPLAVTSEQTLLDLTPSPLLGGDFNEDGVINEVDYALKFLPNFLTDDSVVDLDASGEVNNLDFGIMRLNWSLADDVID